MQKHNALAMLGRSGNPVFRGNADTSQCQHPADSTERLLLSKHTAVVRLNLFVLNPLSNGPAGWGIDVDENDRFVT